MKKQLSFLLIYIGRRKSNRFKFYPQISQKSHWNKVILCLKSLTIASIHIHRTTTSTEKITFRLQLKKNHKKMKKNTKTWTSILSKTINKTITRVLTILTLLWTTNHKVLSNPLKKKAQAWKRFHLSNKTLLNSAKSKLLPLVFQMIRCSFPTIKVIHPNITYPSTSKRKFPQISLNLWYRSLKSTSKNLKVSRKTHRNQDQDQKRCPSVVLPSFLLTKTQSEK